MTPPKPKLTFPMLDRLDRAAFVAALGGVFEHAPWVAEQAWEQRPFANLATLHRVMAGVVAAAGRERQLALIRAHPELAGADAVAGALTAASRQEQGSAGLSTASGDEIARFRELNRRYRDRFGFPFVMAVKGKSKAEILAAFAERLAQSPEAEFDRALAEIARIARLRLETLIEA
ncbi:MAG TPA: 2-oxo-4-hydroxy-4-carboxy-5-ureidoimidazoline decarboxylase [Stellaceae bacterium]|nr:2-oxo-4-hydroxy-4-carboxy-5-ureidoimidazoline decarboxylase [Stellaceae bacterium]